MKYSLISLTRPLMLIVATTMSTTMTDVRIAALPVAGVTPKIIQWSQTAAKLTLAVYDLPPVGDAYPFFQWYNHEPDQTLVARSAYNVCFVAFRGTEPSIADIFQNIIPGTVNVCSQGQDDTTEDTCCQVRRGYYDAYNTSYVHQIEADLQTCTEYCMGKDHQPCPVVLKGHSKGGSVAAIASAILEKYHPYGITFGEIPAVTMPCPLVNASRWFRYINTLPFSLDGPSRLVYDPIPFTIDWGSGDLFGHTIVLSDNGISYIGFDSEDYFYKDSFFLNAYPAHLVEQDPGSTDPGYVERIQNLRMNGTTHVPMHLHDLMTGSLCTTDAECASQQCVYNSTTFSDSQRLRCKGTSCLTNDDCDTNQCEQGTCVL
jgi:hypothetical protein